MICIVKLVDFVSLDAMGALKPTILRENYTIINPNETPETGMKLPRLIFQFDGIICQLEHFLWNLNCFVVNLANRFVKFDLHD